jgi:hypothetical protein
MSEVNRPSSSEEARAAARAHENQKPKKVQKSHNPHSAKQGKAYSQDARSSNSFEGVLRDIEDSNTSTTATTSASIPSSQFDGAMQGVLRQQNRDNRQNEGDDHKDDDYRSTSKDKDHDGEHGVKKGGDHQLKVHGKGSHKGQKQDTGADSQNKEGKQFGGGSHQALDQASLQKANLKNTAQAPAPSPMQASIMTGASAMESAQAAKELPKALLDQIVQYVTIKRGKGLDDEIQIQLNDKIFQGLRIKVTSHQGEEVSVEFIVPNRSVEETFKNEREKIAIALGEKGVDLRDILVTRRN